MKSRDHIVLCLLVLVAVAGCASTKVTERQQLETGQIARPNNIWVYDFVATPADAPTDSNVAAVQGTNVGPHVVNYLLEAKLARLARDAGGRQG